MTARGLQQAGLGVHVEQPSVQSYSAAKRETRVGREDKRSQSHIVNMMVSTKVRANTASIGCLIHLCNDKRLPPCLAIFLLREKNILPKRPLKTLPRSVIKNARGRPSICIKDGGGKGGWAKTENSRRRG